MTELYARKYRLEERIGRGGMAEVFRARMIGPDGFEKIVCLKRILPEHSRSPGFEAMFRDEARLAALLRHASIVQVFDFDRDDDQNLFICMEYVEGVNLRRLLSCLGSSDIRIEPGIAAAVARSVLEGLHHARTARHDGRELRVIHRDISPHNLLVSTSGEVKIADFGIAKALVSAVRTSAGVVKGKASYMSPEQAAGGKLDHRTDLYSLGVVLWEMLAGRRLFPPDADWLRLLSGEREAPPVSSARPSVPPGLARLVDSLLERDRERRPADAAAALEMLAASGVAPSFAPEIARLVHLALPAPDPALQPTAPQPTGPPTVRDAPTRVETPGSRTEAIGSSDILPASPPRETPPLVAETTAPTRTRLRIPIALAAGAFAAAVLVLSVWIALPRRPPDGPPAPAREAPASPPPPVAIEPVAPASLPAPDPPAPALSPAPAGKREPPGSLVVNAKPWAEVLVDGKSAGSTPVARKNLPAGKHTVRILNPSLGVDRSIPVLVKPGKTTKISLDLTSE